MKNNKRREKTADALFRFSEIFFGACLINFWVSEDLPLATKFALAVAIMVLFTIAFFCYPQTSLKKEATND